MITNDVSTLKIHKLTQAQYDRELAAGNLDENALYLTPDEDIEIADVVGLQSALDGKSNTSHMHNRLYSLYGDSYVALIHENGYCFLRPYGEYNGEQVEPLPTVLGSVAYPYYNVWSQTVTTADIECSNKLVCTANADAFFNGVTTFYNSVIFGNSSATIDSYGVYTAYAGIRPTNATGYNINLGLGNNRWANIYSKTTLNVSSDLTVKTDLAEIDDRYIELFDLVQPYAYKFIDGNSGRIHTGFISQYVEQAMEQVGLKDTDFAFFCKDAMYEEIKDENGNVIEEKPILDENGNQKYFYSLRYDEYIAIMTEKIKRMEKRIDELETKLEKVDELEARLATLENA